jgi:ABC-type transport system involved in multi-copper enzyme maturation permease subunit
LNIELNTCSLKEAALQPNPIIVKELRGRMRGGRAYLVLTGYLLGLSIVCYGVLRIVQGQSQIGLQLISAHVGQSMFAALALAETLLITFLTPAMTAGAISSEREQLTYDLLLATPLKPGRILAGKLVSALSYVILLIFAAVPLGSLILIFGGVAPSDLLWAFGLLLLTALATGMLGLLCSAIAKRTLRATIMAYLIILLVVIGSIFGVLLRNAGAQDGPPRATTALAASPFSAMASLVLQGAQPSFGGGMMIEQGFAVAQPAMAFAGPEGFRGAPPMPFPGGGGSNILMNMPPFSMFAFGIIDYTNPNGPKVQPIYRHAYVGYAAWSVACYWLAAHWVRPRRRWRIGWHDLVMLATLAAVLAAGTYWLDVWPWT